MPSDHTTFIMTGCVYSSYDGRVSMPYILYVDKILCESNIIQIFNHLELMFRECQRGKIELSTGFLNHLCPYFRVHIRTWRVDWLRERKGSLLSGRCQLFFTNSQIVLTLLIVHVFVQVFHSLTRRVDHQRDAVACDIDAGHSLLM